MDSFGPVANKNLDEGPRQGKKFCLRLLQYGPSSQFFVNSVKIIKFKPKHIETKPIPICLGNVSTELLADKMKKTR